METAANPTESAGEEDTGDDGAEAEEEQQDNDQQAEEEEAVINGVAKEEEEEEQEESNPTEQVTNQVANCMVIDLNWISLPHPFCFFFFLKNYCKKVHFL